MSVIMGKEEQFREMIFRQLEDLENVCLQEKSNIKRVLKEAVIFDAKRLNKQLSALNVRLVMIEFALLEHRSKAGVPAK